MNNMKFYKILLLFILFFPLTYPSKATDAEQVFKEASHAYQQGDYLLAIDKYESILSASVFSKELYYNLGNSYYRINQTGKAILNYERALRLDPSDKEAQQNLYLAKSHIVENIEPISDIFIVRWVKILRGVFAPNTWAIFTLIPLWFGIAGFIIWLMGKERLWKKRGFIVGLVFTPLSILLFFLAQKASNELISTRFGIITAKKTVFKTSADANAPASFNLHEGIKVEIMERASNMTRIQLPNSEEGWVESNAVEKI
jgi:tetratricopeptide (TPR) repeat protein